ncbi:hypothetical protein DFH08DRAFT_942647 [Mycena albidolilacea]|uniref:Uncharacterized protein n=1 Tax=Mycena albidolilacea TaxID=1033008 RepID=A0AAD6ZD63_9AGAR|nr:hypothetical protein DFH08DRAFT_942647 [Mycena albidolilacea]
MLRFLLFFAFTTTAFAAPAGSSSTCPPRDDAGGALIRETLKSNGQFLDCQYQTAGLCTYFAGGGSFSSGSSVCPDEALVAGSTGSNSGGSNSGSSGSGAATCVYTDDAGGPLMSSSIRSDGFVSCKYQTAGSCEYFSPGGQFSSGSSTCPDSITPGGLSSASGSGGSNSGSSSSGAAICAATDDAGSPLTSSGIDSNGFVSCKYQTAGSCQYFSPGGQFSSGSSTCPDSITSGSKSPAISSFLADSESDKPSTNTSGPGGCPLGVSQPVLIAMFAINGTLVIALLIVTCLWIRGRDQKAKRLSNLRGFHAKSDASRSASVPLTYGADDKLGSVFEDDP